MDEDTAEALVYVGPGKAEIRTVPLPPMAEGLVEIRTTHSALSRGTERLVFEGRVPESEWQRMRAPFQEGDFPFPVVYGYAAVGRVEAGPEALLGRHVFALAPHKSRHRLPAGAVVPLPEGVPPGRAVLGANAETALNGLWDAEAAGLIPGARVLIVGAGLLGCLIAAFLARRGDLAVTVVDPAPGRAETLAPFGVAVTAPEGLSGEHDLAFHTSATPAGLATALGALAFEGRVIELSWYGDAPVPVPLGGAFHARRLAILSSQVGHVAPTRRATTSRRDRLSQALLALADPRLDGLFATDTAFSDLPGALAGLLGARAPGIASRIVHD